MNSRVSGERAYNTNEEMLAEETREFENIIQRGHSNKRKKYNTPPQKNHSGTTVVSEPQKKDPKPPPIFIEKVASFPALKSMIEGQDASATFTTMANNLVKINTSTPDGFCAVTKCFVDNKVPHYTYQSKQDRPIRVMIKGIHKSWSTDEVLADLRDQFGPPSDRKDGVEVKESTRYLYCRLPQGPGC